MGFLLIENKGQLDISSLILLGASTKRQDDSKIGFFGSGNKYAIATLIRHGIPFKIFSGDKEIVIETEDVLFRDMAFKKIIIDGQQTSLTTDMGPQWQPWMAVREWVSNSIDEGQYNIVTDTDAISGRDGYTRFFVQHSPDIKEMIDMWDAYFTFDREDVIASKDLEGKIFPQTDKDEAIVLYRKGIRAYHDKNEKALYQYDMDGFEINESRLIDSLHSAEYTIARYLKKEVTVEVARNILQKAFTKGYLEGRLPWRWAGGLLSKQWRDAIDNHVIIVDNVAGYFMEVQQTQYCYIVSLDMAQSIRNAFPEVKIYGMGDDGNTVAFKNVETNPKQQFLLNECIKFCKDTEYSIDYPIEIVQFEEKATMGMAYQGKILLSDKVFDKGRKEIVLTLIEENEHLKTGYKDMSRAFQNHLFSLFLSEKESRFGFFL